jgi:hypothetical protein
MPTKPSIVFIAAQCILHGIHSLNSHNPPTGHGERALGEIVRDFTCHETANNIPTIPI